MRAQRDRHGAQAKEAARHHLGEDQPAIYFTRNGHGTPTNGDVTKDSDLIIFNDINLRKLWVSCETKIVIEHDFTLEDRVV